MRILALDIVPLVQLGMLGCASSSRMAKLCPAKRRLERTGHCPAVICVEDLLAVLAVRLCGTPLTAAAAAYESDCRYPPALSPGSYPAMLIKVVTLTQSLRGYFAKETDDSVA